MKTLTLRLLFWSLLGVAQLLANPQVEMKAGAFFFTDSSLRKIYDKGGVDLQLAATYPLTDLGCDWTLNAYASIEYFHLNGKSLNNRQKTSIWASPVNLGLRPTFTLNCKSQYYFALGPRYLNLHQRNHSSYVYKNTSKNTFGFFVNTGIQYFFYKNLLIDLFVEYSYAKIDFHPGSQVYTRNTQVGGITIGGALGYEF